MKYEDEYNLTNISLSPHNATHADAPKHFINNGKTIDEVSLERFIGPCRVIFCDDSLGANEVASLVKQTDSRILIKGGARITKEGAKALSKLDIMLVGVDSSSVASPEDSVSVHRILLKKEMGILENLDLSGAPEGSYFLMAQPLKMKGIEASPVRAVLMEI